MGTALGSNQGTGTAGSLTVAATVNVGDTIVGHGNLSSPSVTPTITDSGGNSYGFDIAINANGDFVFRAVATAKLTSGVGTINLGLSASTTFNYDAEVEPGGWTPDGAVPAFTPVTSSNVSAPSVNVPTAGDVAYACASMYSTGTFTATVDAPFTLLDSVAISPRSIASAYLESAAAGSLTATFHWSQSHSQSAVLIPYKAAGGKTGTASFNAVGTLSATGVPHAAGSATFGATGTLAAQGIPHPAGTTTYTAVGTLTAAGRPAITGNVAYTATGTLTASSPATATRFKATGTGWQALTGEQATAGGFTPLTKQYATAGGWVS